MIFVGQLDKRESLNRCAQLYGVYMPYYRMYFIASIVGTGCSIEFASISYIDILETD